MLFSHKNILFLSKKVFVSPYHLQRIFYTLFGKTIGSYIRERRLTETGTDIKIEKQNAFSIIVTTKQFKKTNSFSNELVFLILIK